MIRKHPDIMAANPLRLLKRGFSSYTEGDAQVLAKAGKMRRHDEQRDRRLHEGEEERILEKLADKPDERMLFQLALNTAMRLRECYALELSQISLPKRTITLERTKNGDNRQVPLPSTLVPILSEYISGRDTEIQARNCRLFPYWSGDRDERVLDKVTAELSALFAAIFHAVGSPDLHFHDLRHEATCRLFEKTKLSDSQASERLKRYVHS